MNIERRLELHFYQQNELAVYLEGNSTTTYNEFKGDLLMYILFAVRTLANLGKNEISLSLAQLLGSAKSSEELILIAHHYNENSPQLVNYKGNDGRKLFKSQVSFNDEQNHFKFNYKIKGFGLFSSGLGYYAPNSVLGLLKYFTLKYEKDSSLIEKLVTANSMITNAYTSLTVSNQTEISFHIFAAVIAEEQ